MNYKEDFRKIYENFCLSSFDIDSEIDFVIEIVSELKPKDFILGKSLNSVQKQKITDILTKRAITGKPVQQIVGQAFFAGDKFFVNEYTLIPRPETELLIEVLKQKYQNTAKLNILDIGTGSGCIAIELVKNFPNAKADAVDICQHALDISMENAKKHNVNDRLNFYLSDIFLNVKEKFDVIVSNPPYIAFSDKNEVQKEVLEFEPKTALFAEDNGLFFYKKIISEAKIYLKEGGMLLFEIGEKQGKSISLELEKYNFQKINVIQDLDGKDRVIFAYLN